MPLLGGWYLLLDWLAYGANRDLMTAPAAWLTAGGIWLAALLSLLAIGHRWPLADETVVAAQDEEIAPQRSRLRRLLSGGVWLGCSGFYLPSGAGGGAWLSGSCWRGGYEALFLAWAAPLPFLPVVPLTIAGVTAVMVATLSLLCLFGALLGTVWGRPARGSGRISRRVGWFERRLAGTGCWSGKAGSITAGLLLGSVMPVDGSTPAVLSL